MDYHQNAGLTAKWVHRFRLLGIAGLVENWRRP